MSKRIIIVALALIIVVTGGYFIYKGRTALSSSPTASYGQAPGTAMHATGATSTPVAVEAWSVFERYLAAAQGHDAHALQGLAYKLSPTCADPKQAATCYAHMDSVAAIGKAFNQTDFSDVEYDDRQIIMSTPWHLEESSTQIGEGRSSIYFVRDTSGTPHVLFFTQPEEILYSFIDPAQTHAQLVERLEERTIDSDNDGIEDEYETCSYQGAASSTPACISTDPHKMDTDGDGWWDSADLFIQ